MFKLGYLVGQSVSGFGVLGFGVLGFGVFGLRVLGFRELPPGLPLAINNMKL